MVDAIEVGFRKKDLYYEKNYIFEISVSCRLHTTIWINLFQKFNIFSPALQVDLKKLVLFGTSK